MDPILPWLFGSAVLVLLFGKSKPASEYPRVMTDEQRTALITQLANEYQIEPAVALAVFDVESGSKGFKNDRLIIRFEPHIFKKRTGRQVSLPRTGQDSEYAMLEQARAIDDTQGLRAISMGASQIMGFNHKIIGYPTVQDMYADFQRGEAMHIEGFFRFVAANKKLLQAARDKDFATFAYYYNGPKGVGVYDPKMIKRYNVWKSRGVA